MIPILLISLLITLVCEASAALVWKIRDPKDLALVCLANVLTNPPLVLTVYAIRLNSSLPSAPITAVLEIMAVLLEGRVYHKYGKTIAKPFLFSIFANSVSFLAGFLL